MSQKDQTESTKKPVKVNVTETSKPKGFKYRFRVIGQSIRKHKKWFLIAAVLLAVFIVVAIAVKPIRYGILNTFSHTRVSVEVIDAETMTPLSDAKVQIGDQTVQTDKTGRAYLDNASYGVVSYTISKEPYTSYTNQAELSSAQNSLPTVKLTSDGVAVKVSALNKLADKPLRNFSVKLDGSTIKAQSNTEGMALVRVPLSKLSKATITIEAEGFNAFSQILDAKENSPSRTVTVSLTPTGKVYYLSNRTGTVDIYSANLDGSDQQLVIAGKNNDPYNNDLQVARDQKTAVLISSRDGLRDANGYRIRSIYIVDLTLKTLKRVDDGSGNVSPIGWSDRGRFIYATSEGNYGADNYYKIKSLNLANGQTETVYSQRSYINANLFAEAASHLYVSVPNNAGQNELTAVSLTSKQVNKLYTSNDYISLQHKELDFAEFNDGGKSFTLNLKNQKVEAQDGPTSDDYRMYYLDNSAKRVAWVERRDGSSVVLMSDISGNNLKTVASSPNTQTITNWIGSDYLVVTEQSSKYTQQNLSLIYVPSGKYTKLMNIYSP